MMMKEEEERESDPDEEGSEQSELFESSVAPIAAGKSALAPKGKPALVEAKGQKVPVQLPSKPSSGRPKANAIYIAQGGNEETRR